MKEGPSIAPIAALVGDPARANMLAALSGGISLTASELAHEAGVTVQTASSHLSKLETSGLLAMMKQGRHRYFRLANEDVARMLEAIMGVAARTGQLRTRPGPRDPELRRARICYDHLAGEIAVALLDRLIEKDCIARNKSDELALTRQGHNLMNLFGIGVDSLLDARRPVCRACLDWSMRRHHLGGALGAALFARLETFHWIRRERASRVVRVTLAGEAGLERIFGPLPVAVPARVR